MFGVKTPAGANPQVAPITAVGAIRNVMVGGLTLVLSIVAGVYIANGLIAKGVILILVSALIGASVGMMTADTVGDAVRAQLSGRPTVGPYDWEAEA